MTGVGDPRLPVLILSGFLGSGKTTLLRAALLRSDLGRTLVIVNEAAPQGVDDRLLAASGPVLLLGNGCLCCSINDDLGRSLLRIAEDESLLRSVDRIVIETSGLADPAPAFAALARAGQVSSRMRLHAIVTLVDAMHAGAQAGESPEFALQVQAADCVLVSKLELPGAAPLASVRELVERINPAAGVEAADAATLAALFRRDSPSRADRMAADWVPGRCAVPLGGTRVRIPLATAPGRHGGDVRSFCFEFEQRVDWNALSVWLSLMLHVHGSRLLRIKGFVAVDQGSAPVVIHCVRHIVHFPEHLADWPDERRTSYLVFIVRDLEPEQVLRSFLAFTGRAGARMAVGPVPTPHRHSPEAAST